MHISQHNLIITNFWCKTKAQRKFVSCWISWEGFLSQHTLFQKKIVKTFTVARKIHQRTFWWLCPCLSRFLGVKNGVSLAYGFLKCFQYISPPAGIMGSGDWGCIYHYFWNLALLTLNISEMISLESEYHSEVTFSWNINERRAERNNAA